MHKCEFFVLFCINLYTVLNPSFSSGSRLYNLRFLPIFSFKQTRGGLYHRSYKLDKEWVSLSPSVFSKRRLKKSLLDLDCWYGTSKYLHKITELSSLFHITTSSGCRNKNIFSSSINKIQLQLSIDILHDCVQLFWLLFQVLATYLDGGCVPELCHQLIIDLFKICQFKLLWAILCLPSYA